MKSRLEKPAVTISKPTGGKNEKPRREDLQEKLRLNIYILLTGNTEWKSK